MQQIFCQKLPEKFSNKLEKNRKEETFNYFLQKLQATGLTECENAIQHYSWLFRVASSILIMWTHAE